MVMKLAARLVSSLFPSLRCLPLPSEGRVAESQGDAILGQEAAQQQQKGRKWMERTDINNQQLSS